MLRNSQVAILQMLQVQKFSESEAQSRTFGYCALTLLSDQDPQTKKDIQYLIDNGYLNNKNGLTKKGELATTLRVKQFTNQEVGKRLNLFLYESLGRNIAAEAMKYWSDETLSKTMELILAEVFERTQEKTFSISEDAVAYLQNFNSELAIQTPETVIVENDVVEVVQAQDVPKTKRKAKKGVL